MENNQSRLETVLKKALGLLDVTGLVGGFWSEKGACVCIDNDEAKSFVMACTNGYQFDFQKCSNDSKTDQSRIFGRDEIITAIKIYKQELLVKVERNSPVHHEFLVLKTVNSQTRVVTYWSVEKGRERIHVQRSANEKDVTDFCWSTEADSTKTKRPPFILLFEKVKGTEEGNFQSNTDMDQVLMFLIPMLKDSYMVMSSNCQKFVADLYYMITDEDWQNKERPELEGKRDYIELLRNYQDAYKQAPIRVKQLLDDSLLGPTQIVFIALRSHWPSSQVTLLLNQPGVDPKSTDDDGQSLLMVALIEADDLRIFGKLINGSDLKAKDNNGNSVVHCAARNKNPSIIRYITRVLKKNKLFSIREESNLLGENPLHYAINRSHCLENVKVLVQVIDMNNQTKDELKTPLHLAVQQRNEEVARLLVGEGCNLYLEDKLGQTPYDLAVKLENYELAKMLSRKRKRDED